MTAATLALPAPLCEICGDGADETYPEAGYFARGRLVGMDSPICLECAAFAVWEGMHDAAEFEWWTPQDAMRFVAQCPRDCPNCRRRPASVVVFGRNVATGEGFSTIRCDRCAASAVRVVRGRLSIATAPAPAELLTQAPRRGNCACGEMLDDFGACWRCPVTP